MYSIGKPTNGHGVKEDGGSQENRYENKEAIIIWIHGGLQ